VVSCMKEETSPQQPSVLIDYVTDGILISAIDVSGMLRVSPDLRQLVAVKRGSVTIYRVQDNGLISYVIVLLNLRYLLNDLNVYCSNMYS